MWFSLIGFLLLVASILGPRFGFNLYSGGAPGTTRGKVDNSLASRVGTGLIGLVLIIWGMSDLYPK
jgi:hypothetical protein